MNVIASIRRASRQLAFTLVEMLIAVSIGSLLMAAVGSFALFTARSFVALGNYSDLNNRSRDALDRMSREIRQMRSMTSFATNEVAFQDLNNNSIVYRWTPPTGKNPGTLVRIYNNGPKQVLLEQCDFLQFGISQRNPSNNFVFDGTQNANMAKLVDVSWRCSRQILQAKVNTESVQTAKTVIRN